MTGARKQGGAWIRASPDTMRTHAHARAQAQRSITTPTPCHAPQPPFQLRPAPPFPTPYHPRPAVLPSHISPPTRMMRPLQDQQGHVTASKRATTRVTPFHYATTPTTNVTSTQHPMPVPTLPYPPIWQQSTESCDYIKTRTTSRNPVPPCDRTHHCGPFCYPSTF